MANKQITGQRQAPRPIIGSSGPRGPLTFLGVFVFVGLWMTLSEFGFVNSLILPSPVRVIGSARDVGLVLIIHLLATLTRVAVGFGFGSLAGLGTGLLMQYDSRVFQALDGMVETFRPVPPVAVVPFLILIFGFSELGKIVIATLGVALVVTISTIEAIERVPAPIIRWGLVAGLTRKQLYRLVILPAAFPDMRGGFRISLALAITLVVVSEFMGATWGLGYLISVSKVTLTTPTMLLAIVLLGWIGWGLDRLLRLIFDRTTAWDLRAKGATR